MCGRTACTLHPDDIRKCCTYTNQNGNKVVPQWINQDLYHPSYNLGPTRHSPVLTSNKNESASFEDERILQSMTWGLDIFGFGSKPTQVINARCETLLEKNTFKFPLKAGNRCVVLADGYYEWFRSGKVKEPHFFHMPQEDGIVIHQAWKVEDDEKKRPHLLAMAGIYQKIKGDDEKYGYVVITVPASKAVEHVHDRMPAILENENAIADWLNTGTIPAQKAIDQLKPIEDIKHYRVSTCVNNVRNNTPECIQPFINVDIKPRKPSVLEGWLIKRSAQVDTSAETCKKIKSE
uniref:Abasic site processing protein HMCES n=1 Tax=Strigamia maritima TaxID=126957 RepID=T1J1B1_STRMM